MSVRQGSCAGTLNAHVVVVVVSHIQRIDCQPEKPTLRVDQFCSWSAEQGKENKKIKLAAPPPPTPPPHASRWKKIIYKSREASTCLGATQVSIRLTPVQDFFGSSTRPMGAASRNSTLPCAKITFSVTLLLSSPGDVYPRLHIISCTRS